MLKCSVYRDLVHGIKWENVGGGFNNPQALHVFQGRLRIGAARKFYKLA